MKKIMRLYNSYKTSIRVTFFGLVLITIGFLIKNENVNLFYTFRSPYVLFAGEFLYNIGKLVFMNLPLIFLLNGVCKKANNASVVITALVGYFTFAVTTMLFATQTLGAQAYSNGLGINSVFNFENGTLLPLETGLIGSMCVAFLTRISFIYSRHRGNYSIFNLLSKETTGLIMNIILCFLLGIAVSYLFPIGYGFLDKAISFISSDLIDPYRIGLYASLDRLLSDFGLSNIIRYPFWYTSLGGSYSNPTTGAMIMGDVNIWNAIKNTIITYDGAGRFITYYYIINMFMVPAIYFGTWLSLTDKNDKRSLILLFSAGSLLSFVAGNPLPLEYLLMFTTPFLYAFYIIMVGVVAGSLIYFKAYLGFSPIDINIPASMPGSFPDFVINLRNASLSHSLATIVYVGIAAFAVCAIVTVIYYRGLSYDFTNTGKLKTTALTVIDALGGKENIQTAGSGLFKLNVYLNDPEKISIEKVRTLGPDKIVETKRGISLEYGSSSTRIAAEIRKQIKV